MMLDLGLTAGVKELWQENLLRDYTVVVQGHEFKVHKVVLAAVSKYFKALFGEGFIESEMDNVKLAEFSPDVVSKLLDFIYTAEESTIEGDTLEVLRCSMYLQMPLVSQFCAEKLVENQNIDNCLEVLSVLDGYAFTEEVFHMKVFIQTNFDDVFGGCSFKMILPEHLVVLLDCWRKSDWEMFLFVKNWINVDYKKRVQYVNDLMCQVRFCLISPENLEVITGMDVFTKTKGSWHDLVVNATKYHQQPINLKIVDSSEQSKVRTEALPTYFVPKQSEGSNIFFAVKKENKLKKYEQNPAQISGLSQASWATYREVNNFLIVYGLDRHVPYHEWLVFDPRTLAWSKMAAMAQAKSGFTMVHYDGLLYIIGGEYSSGVSCYDMEQFNFLTNKWTTSVHKLPASLIEPAACVLKDTIYVNGGLFCDNEEWNTSKELYCLDLSLDRPEWESKAPCKYESSRHKMGCD